MAKFTLISTFTLIIGLISAGCSTNTAHVITTEESLQSILSNLQGDEEGIEVEIKDIQTKEMGFDLEYSITAKENIYLIDYNKIDCENEVRERLVYDDTLYFIFHGDLSLQCTPFTDYYVSPPWPLILMKKDETVNFKTYISKEPFDDDSYAQKMENINVVNLVFGYIPEDKLKESIHFIEAVEDVEGKEIKMRQIEVDLHKYKIVDTDIKWNL